MPEMLRERMGQVTSWQQNGLTLYHGDCREVMAALPAESVSCVITSPPFWGLRAYACEPSIWGGAGADGEGQGTQSQAGTGICSEE